LITPIQLKYFYLLTISLLMVMIIGVATENFVFLTLPFIIIVLVAAFYYTEILWLTTIFLTPLAINLEELDLGIGVSLPTEPIFVGLMLLYFFRFFIRKDYDKRIFIHPVSIIIYLYLFWQVITTLTSEMPLVSFKATLAKFWFITVIYFMGIEIFKKYGNTKKFLWLYLSAITLVIIYTTIHHISYGLTERSAHWVMQPFYKDHTAYGAAMAFIIPAAIAFTLKPQQHAHVKGLGVIIIAILITGTILSYTRAAWLSLGVAAVVSIIYLLRIRVFYLLASAIFLIGLFLTFQEQIIIRLKKNTQDSSTEFSSHVQSMSNISTDASNLERINRWNSAFRMFKARPVFGWGPGTYTFQYAPYQVSSELTIISTNLGTGGNAHSEYLGPLAESGLLGTITFVLLLITVLYVGTRVYVESTNREVRIITLASILGLITYFTHGFLNNFLDTDKAAVPFWGMIAIIVAMDIYHKHRLQE
jgi:putative inorganic carbon (hco3(-)) transporter